MIPGLARLSYEERLKETGLYTVERRRLLVVSYTNLIIIVFTHASVIKSIAFIDRFIITPPCSDFE